MPENQQLDPGPITHNQLVKEVKEVHTRYVMVGGKFLTIRLQRPNLRRVTPEHHLNEVKEIYAGLVMVEKKFLEISQHQTKNAKIPTNQLVTDMQMHNQFAKDIKGIYAGLFVVEESCVGSFHQQTNITNKALKLDKTWGEETRMLFQPETRPITKDQLVNEVKGIYAGLVMVEKECVEMCQQQTKIAKTLMTQHLTNMQMHNQTANEIKNIYAGLIIMEKNRVGFLYQQTNITNRSPRLPDSPDHIFTFVYPAYYMVLVLKESILCLVETGIEYYGELVWYRMAIEEADLRDREIWSNVARMWYNRAADRSPNVGRIQHHLAVLARPNIVQQLFYYSKALVSLVPFVNARESVMLMYSPFLDHANKQRRSFATKASTGLSWTESKDPADVIYRHPAVAGDATEVRPQLKSKLSDEQWQTLIALHYAVLHNHYISFPMSQLLSTDKRILPREQRDFFLAPQHPKTTHISTQQRQALIALHRTLLHEHHDFFWASQHPTASPTLRRLATKYAMPARMWRRGIHSFLELLRHRLPESLDHVLAFVYLAYSLMALLKESVPSFVETWIECLGDLARYRMAIKEANLRDREIWSIFRVGRLQMTLLCFQLPMPVCGLSAKPLPESPINANLQAFWISMVTLMLRWTLPVLTSVAIIYSAETRPIANPQQGFGFLSVVGAMAILAVEDENMSTEIRCCLIVVEIYLLWKYGDASGVCSIHDLPWLAIIIGCSLFLNSFFCYLFSPSQGIDPTLFKSLLCISIWLTITILSYVRPRLKLLGQFLTICFRLFAILFEPLATQGQQSQLLPR